VVSTKFPELLAQFYKESGWRCNYWYQPNEGVLEDIRNEMAEVGFLLTGVKEISDDFDTVVLKRSNLYVALPSGHPLSAKKVITKQDLAGESLIALRERELPYNVGANIYKKIITDNPNISVLYAEDMITAMTMVRGSMGVTIVSADIFPIQDSIAIVPYEVQIDTYLVGVQKKGAKNPQVHQLLEYLKEYVQKKEK
jgi:DNA-binding transcriptional LysR family regulator